MLVWEGAVGKLKHMECTAFEWVNPDLEKGGLGFASRGSWIAVGST